MDIYSIIRVGKNFLKKNGPMILGLAATGVCFILRTKFNVPMGMEAFGGIQMPTITNEPLFIRAPENSLEESILALYKTSRGRESGFYKTDIANKIYDLVAKNDISDTTKSYAIQILSNIGSSIDSGFYKSEIVDLITKISVVEEEVK